MPVKEVEKFMIIGLGIFGSELAIDLSRKGHQVIGVDSDRDRANRLKDILENTFIGKKNVEITVSLDEDIFENISNYLEYNKNLNKCIINIGGVNFIFLKK